MSLGFEAAQSLFRRGQYADIAADQDSRLERATSLAPEHRILVAEALCRAGELDTAVSLAKRHNISQTSPSIKARYEAIVACAYRRDADLGRAIHHLQAAFHLAKESGDPSAIAWTGLQLFRTAAQLRPAAALEPLLRDVRRYVTKAGDTQATAYLHNCIALMEASAGRREVAKRHLDISQSLNATCPNAWIEQLNYLGASFLHLFQGEYKEAIQALGRARDLAAAVGEYQTPTLDCNQAHALLVTGEFESAERLFRRVVARERRFFAASALEGLARTYLAKGELEACASTVQEFSKVAHDGGLGDSFAARWTGVTEIKLLLLQKEWPRAAARVAELIATAEAIDDRALLGCLRLLRCEALAAAGRSREAIATFIHAAAGSVPQAPVERSVVYRAAAALAQQPDPGLNRTVLERARATWDHQGDRASALEIEQCSHLRSLNGQFGTDHATVVVNSVAAALTLGNSPNLLGRELLQLLRVVGCESGASVVEIPGVGPSREPPGGISVPLGEHRGKTVVLTCRAPSTGSTAVALADIVEIARSARLLEKYRADERRRAAIWTPDIADFDPSGIFLAEEMQELLVVARRVAPTNVPVLITGETGTGKEVLARVVHAASRRSKGAFLPFNCTSTPRDMLDSQLFGHRRGSFTGATEHFQGIIRGAAGGTLFLDEIGDMSLEVQPKLLRFLEAGEVHPVGEMQPVRADVRVIAATNADLDTLVSQGRFREDLFYRLNIVRLHVPPLRERRVEIPALAHHYLQKHAQECGKGELRLAEETMEYLVLYRWPGNVRQLANEMRRMAALAETGAVLMPEHLSREIAASRRTIPASERTLDQTEVVVRMDQPLPAAIQHLERAMLQYALARCGGRIEETAAMLGLSRKGLYLKRQRFGIDAPDAPRVEVAQQRG